MDGLLHHWKPMLLGSFPPCFLVKLVASARTSDNKLLCGKGISGCSSHFIPLKSGAFAGFRSGPPVEWAASEHPVVWQRTSPWGWPHLHRWTCSERCIWALRCATHLQSRAIPWAQRSGEITGGQSSWPCLVHVMFIGGENRAMDISMIYDSWPLKIKTPKSPWKGHFWVNMYIVLGCFR